MSTNKSSIIGATMMVTGCCIGAGMIGLPVLSALTGFVPSIVAMLFSYIFTTLTGLLLVEATLWFEGPVNLPSIVEHTLGKAGKIATILLFLFLFYCIFVAYLDAGGTMFAEMLSAFLHVSVSPVIGMMICVAFIAGIAYAGTAVADSANRYMLFAMVASYVILIGVALPNTMTSNLLYTNWKLMYGVVPILLISFGYQNLVPSITHYLKRNINAIRFAIIIGNLIPFFVYFLWEYVVLGMLPGGKANTNDDVQLVAQLLQGAAVSSLSVMFFIKSFSLFAMLTSFLASAVSFVDFLKDGFKKLHHNKLQNELLYYGLVFVPPAVFTLIHPKLFLHALGFAGGFIDVLLFGVLPASVILVGRHIRKTSGQTAAYQVVGGYATPAVILLLSVAMLVLKFL